MPHKRINSLLANALKNEFYLSKKSALKTHIITKSKEDFNVAKDILNKEKTQFHSFTPIDEKALNYLIKKLDKDFTKIEVKETILEQYPDLKIIKFDPYEIARRFLANNPNKYKNSHIWHLQVAPDTDIPKLLNIQFLCHQRIIIEKQRKAEISQCFNCQRYGHVANNCHREARCVKCGQSHEKGDWPLPGK